MLKMNKSFTKDERNKRVEVVMNQVLGFFKSKY